MEENKREHSRIQLKKASEKTEPKAMRSTFSSLIIRRFPSALLQAKQISQV